MTFKYVELAGLGGLGTILIIPKSVLVGYCLLTSLYILTFYLQQDLSEGIVSLSSVYD